MTTSSLGKPLSLILILLALTLAFSATPSRASAQANGPLELQVYWQSPTVNSIQDCAWSPDGSKLAVSAWYKSGDNYYGRIMVFAKNGSLLWYRNFVNPTSKIAWSPDGSLIAFYNGSLTVMDSWGHGLWSKDRGIRGVTGIAWSSDGSKIAVSFAYSNVYGDHGGVHVYGVHGKPLWNTTDIGPVYKVAWSPDSPRLAAIRGYDELIVYNGSSGVTLWSITTSSGDIRDFAWSPRNNNIAVAYGYTIAVFTANGVPLWETGYLGGQVLSVAWNPSSTIIAGSASNGHIYGYYSTGDMAYDIGLYADRLEWSPDSDALAAYNYEGNSVYVIDGRHGILLWYKGVNSYTLVCSRFNPAGGGLITGGYYYDNDGVRHSIIEYLSSPYTVVVADARGWSVDSPVRVTVSSTSGSSYSFRTRGGDVQAIYLESGGTIIAALKPDAGNPVVVKTIKNPESLSATTVPVPDPSKVFGRIVVDTGSRVNLTLRWGSEKKTLVMGEETSTVLWASPGEYIVEYKVLPPQNYVGEPEALGEVKTQTLTVDVGEAKTIEIKGYGAMLGRIVVKAGSPATLIVSWSGGSKTFAVEGGGTLQLWAAPGGYTVKQILEKPGEYIGPENALVKTSSIAVRAGDSRTLTIPSYSSALARVSIESRAAGTITITWGGSSKAFNLNPGENITLWAAPGEYQVAYTLDRPQYYIGDPKWLSWTTSMVVRAGGTATLELSREARLARVIVGVGDTKASVSFRGEAGSGEVDLPAHDSAIIWVQPGGYTITITLAKPSNYIGDTSALEIVKNARLEAGLSIKLTAPNLEEALGRLTIRSGSNATVTFMWSGGKQEIRVGQGGEASYWIAPGDYEVSYTLDKPSNYVGDAGALTGTAALAVQANWRGTLRVPGLDDKLGQLVINNNINKAKQVLVTWKSGSSRINIQAKSAITLWAAPGSYTISYQLDKPENYAGPNSALTRSIKTTISSPGERKEVSLEDYKHVLAAVRITVPSDSTLIVKGGWGTSKVQLSRGANQVWLPPGNYKLVLETREAGSILYKPVSYSVNLAPGKLEQVAVNTYPHSPVYYAIIGAIAGAIAYIALLHPIVLVRDVGSSEEGIIEGLPLKIKIEIFKWGLLPAKKTLKIIVEGYEEHQESLRLGKPGVHTVEVEVTPKTQD